MSMYESVYLVLHFVDESNDILQVLVVGEERWREGEGWRSF